MVEPLKKRTMTLSQLQVKTLDVLRKVKFQLRRQGYEGGMSDEEFIEQILEPLETNIYQDRVVIKMAKATSRGKR